MNKQHPTRGITLQLLHSVLLCLLCWQRGVFLPRTARISHVVGNMQPTISSFQDNLRIHEDVSIQTCFGQTGIQSKKENIAFAFSNRNDHSGSKRKVSERPGETIIPFLTLTTAGNQFCKPSSAAKAGSSCNSRHISCAATFPSSQLRENPTQFHH